MFKENPLPPVPATHDASQYQSTEHMHRIVYTGLVLEECLYENRDAFPYPTQSPVAQCVRPPPGVASPLVDIKDVPRASRPPPKKKANQGILQTR